MQSRLNPYLNFNGNAREAMEFYKSVLGGTLTVSTYKEGGMNHNPAEDNKIMHAMLITDDGITLMGADSPEGWEFVVGTNVSMSLSGENTEVLTGYFDKLSEGGNVREPLKQAPWGDTFGMLIDKYGIRWMVNINQKKS